MKLKEDFTVECCIIILVWSQTPNIVLLMSTRCIINHIFYMKSG